MLFLGVKFVIWNIIIAVGHCKLVILLSDFW